MHYSIKHLCSVSGLSRSTLLYYDSIGLLKASARSRANYRRYSDDDLRRLHRIVAYRRVGLRLDEIRRVLDGSESVVRQVLQQHLRVLDEEVLRIRQRQRAITEILRDRTLLRELRIIDRDTLVGLFSSAGFDDSGLDALHANLERISPAAHKHFLRSLGLPAGEIAEIRRRARARSNAK